MLRSKGSRWRASGQVDCTHIIDDDDNDLTCVPYSLELNVVKYVIKSYQKEYKKSVNGIILLQPTSPFRKLKLVLKSINSYKRDGYNYVSITKDKNLKANKLYLNTAIIDKE